MLVISIADPPRYLRDEELEGSESRDVHEQRKPKTYIEKEAKNLAIELEVHEVRDNHQEFDHHHGEQ